jgi:hypothetical protein
MSGECRARRKSGVTAEGNSGVTGLRAVAAPFHRGLLSGIAKGEQ